MSMETEISLVKIEQACGDCYLRNKCFFGKPALEILRDDRNFAGANMRKQAIVYIWTNRDMAKDCPKPESINETVNKLLENS